MANSTNVLTKSEVQDIWKQVIDIYSEDASGKIVLDTKVFKAKVDNILEQCTISADDNSLANFTYKYRSDGSIKGLMIARQNVLMQKLMAEAYLLIFQFREYLMGTSISYRFYVDNSAYAMTDQNILEYIKFGQVGLEMNPRAAKRDQKDLLDTQYTAMMQKYYGIFTDDYYMKKVDGISGLRASGQAYYRYRGEGLLRSRSKWPPPYQVFNKGHIIEAIDNAISNLLKDATNDPKIAERDQNIEQEALAKYVFGKYLAFDHINATKRPDNIITQTSIKAGQSDLYDYRTIVRQLTLIKRICDKKFAKNELKKKIAQLFMHQTLFENNSKQLMLKKAEEIVDNKLSNLVRETFKGEKAYTSFDKSKKLWYNKNK